MAAQPQQRCDQRINIGTGVIERERWAHAAFYAKPPQNRLRTIVARAHRNTLAIERRTNIFRPVAIDYKRNHARLFLRRADQPQS